MSASVDAPATAVVRREEFSAHSRLHLTGPHAARGKMPFAGHRTQQQVREAAGRVTWRGREMTDKERERDAINGSAMLLEATLKANRA